MFTSKHTVDAYPDFCCPLMRTDGKPRSQHRRKRLLHWHRQRLLRSTPSRSL